MAIEGVSVTHKGIEVIYQSGYDDDSVIAEPAIIIRKYEGDMWGIIQGDNEITIGGKKSMLQLAKAIREWGKW
jgi:hypothetical protein